MEPGYPAALWPGRWVVTVMVAQLGARRHYAVPRALHRRGMLCGLTTDICADGAPWRQIGRMVPRAARPGPLKRILGRTGDGLPPRLVRNLTGFALSPSLRRRQGELQTDHWARRNAAFGRAVAARGFDGADAVYGFNAAALEIFQAARAQGLATILDQTAAPWRYNAALLGAEAQAFPDWEALSAEIDASGRLAEREEAEWGLADRIVCGSAFAAEAVAECGGPRERCVVLPYAGHVETSPHANGGRRTEGPLRVLFAGALQLRKGLPYLAQAMEALAGRDIEFRLVGKTLLTETAMKRLTRHADYKGAVARSEMAGHYGWADVFVLPTLSEGSANVVYEAMAAGLAVVTTPNAGSVVQHGITGMIVPPRDGDALAAAISRLEEDPDLRRRLGAAALESRAPFEEYVAGLAHIVSNLAVDGGHADE